VLEDLVARLEKALDSLPETYRQAFVMHRFNNKSYKDIASEMGISQKTVEYRISQAIRQLRVELKDFLPLLGIFLANPSTWN
jgi:RNA polymerase sigma-70 factor (ECF subfamily)